MRSSVAEGFYPAQKAELKRMLDKLFSEVNCSSSLKNICGAVVPHAGYYYSGRIAAMAYSLLNSVDTAILLGTNHTGMGEKIAVSCDTWQTPLGDVRTDIKLAREIVAEGKGVLAFDEVAHSQEHSIEVQLPFLQHRFPSCRLVAISISSDMYSANYGVVAEAIAKAAKGTNCVVIASSDFTHLGAHYGFMPKTKNPSEWVREADNQIITEIKRLDSDAFLRLGRQTTACGIGAVATLISYMKRIDADSKAELIDYKTSFDISGKNDAIVGYAGIVFGK